jgi:hypothetical protein
MHRWWGSNRRPHRSPLTERIPGLRHCVNRGFLYALSADAQRTDFATDCRFRLRFFTASCRFVDEEPGQGRPTHEGESNRNHSRNFHDPALRFFADRDAPADAEIPDSVAKVVRSRRNPNDVDQELNRILQLVMPRVKFDDVGIARRILVNRRCRNVEDQERKDSDAASAL